jgi:hypothetical protein
MKLWCVDSYISHGRISNVLPQRVDSDAEPEKPTSKARLPKKRKSDTQDDLEPVKSTKVVKRKSTPTIEKPTKAFKSAVSHLMKE